MQSRCPLRVGMRQLIGGNSMLFRYLTGTSWLRLRTEGGVTDRMRPIRGAVRAWATTCLIQPRTPTSFARMSSGKIR